MFETKRKSKDKYITKWNSDKITGIPKI